jgi:hypothetical protein
LSSTDSQHLLFALPTVLSTENIADSNEVSERWIFQFITIYWSILEINEERKQS